MDRRSLLRAAAAAGAGLAGCLEAGDDPGEAGGPGDGSPTGTAGRSPTGTESGGSDGGGGDDGSATDDGASGTGEDTQTETDGATETPDGSGGSNEVVGRSFEAAGSECGQGANRADVTRGDDRVNVDGTISGRNGCYTAELEDATYDEGADELTVAVRSYDDSDEGEACQQCIVDVDYRASVEFRDGTPESVTVVHNGDRVTTE